MINYIKIPREIIYDTSLTANRVAIFSYLCARRSPDDTVAFSTEEICHWSNRKSSSRPGSVNQKYSELLLELSKRNYFTEYPDFAIKERDIITRYQKVRLNTRKFDVADNFGVVYFDELDKITNFKENLRDIDIDTSRTYASYILLLLSYIRCNLNYSENNPRCCFRLYKTISDDIGLSEEYVSRIVKILEALEIIHCKPMKRILLKDKTFLTTPKIFTDYRRFCLDAYGNQILDHEYDSSFEIQKQINHLEAQQRGNLKCKN